MTEKVCIFIVLLGVLLLVACTGAETRGCDQPPKEGFSESDLVGTWVGSIESPKDSFIVIKGDGTYKQRMNIKRTGFSYDGVWQSWSLTHSENGLPYLHLSGLRMCAYWYQMDCATGKTRFESPEQKSGKDWVVDDSYWYDACLKKWIYTPDEGVFMVWGIPARYDIELKASPRGIKLVPFTKSFENTGPSYRLLEP